MGQNAVGMNQRAVLYGVRPLATCNIGSRGAALNCGDGWNTLTSPYEEVLTRAVALKPADRFPTAADFAHGFTHAKALIMYGVPSITPKVVPSQPEAATALGAATNGIVTCPSLTVAQANARAHLEQSQQAIERRQEYLAALRRRKHLERLRLLIMTTLIILVVCPGLLWWASTAGSFVR